MGRDEPLKKGAAGNGVGAGGLKVKEGNQPGDEGSEGRRLRFCQWGQSVQWEHPLTHLGLY